MSKCILVLIMICSIYRGYGVNAQAILEYGASPSTYTTVASPFTITDTVAPPPSAIKQDNTYQLGQGGFRGQTTIFNPDVPDAEHFEENVSDAGTNSLLNTVKTVINRVLGLLAFIALCFLLYGGFKILIAGTDDGAVGEAQTIVKNAAYGILFIALSWIIVTFIFYIASILTEDSDTNTTTNSITSDQIDPSPTQ